MINVRFHGRGGQGAVTSAEVLAIACGFEGKYAQALPSFGPERTGAPVVSFCRINESPIKVYQQVYHPDYVIVLDESLLKVVDVLTGLKKGGHLIINSKNKNFKCAEGVVHFIDAHSISTKIIGRPFVNIAMLGAFAKVSKLISLESIKKAVIQRFGEEVGEKNFKAAEECYKMIE
jgi:pyruvate ferredoxin oxidoreductase gamma subunit